MKNKLGRTLFTRSVLYAIERHQLRDQLQQEKDKSDALLRNILPEAIAEEFKKEGKTEARYHEEVSVLFVDFAGFTRISASIKRMESNEGTVYLLLLFRLCD